MLIDGIILGFIVVAIVLVASLSGLPPSLAIALAALAAAVSTCGVVGAVEVYVQNATSLFAIQTVASVAGIAWLVSLYRNTGLAGELGGELSRVLRSPKLAAAGVPAFMGLLPVPGGALMSASIVDEIGSKLGWSSEKKLFINIWFRHALVIAYPLNSLIVVVSSLVSVSVWAIVLWTLPVSLLMSLIGFLLMRGDGGVVEKGGFDSSKLVRGLAPLSIAVAVALLGELAGLNSRVALLIGVLASMAALVAVSGLPASRLVAPARDSTVWDISIVAFSALVMRDAFSRADYSSVASFSEAWGALSLVLIPALFGLVTGAVSAGVSISIPMLSSLLDIGAREAALVYVAAFTGYMVSPLHLCLVYTLRYYRVDLIRAYRLLIPASVVLLALSAVILLFSPRGA